jgi:hypothetical protein
VPLDVVLRLIGFLELVDTRSALAVRTIRKAAGGKEPPAHLYVRELRMPTVVLEYLQMVPVGSPELITYIMLWRRHVETLDALGNRGWICFYFMDPALVQAMLPDTIMFPRLTTLKLSTTDWWEPFTRDLWNAILDQCPRLDQLELHLKSSLVVMNNDTDWTPRTPRQQPWRSFVIYGRALSPRVLTDIANPDMVALECDESKWTVDDIRALCKDENKTMKRLNKCRGRIGAIRPCCRANRCAPCTGHGHFAQGCHRHTNGQRCIIASPLSTVERHCGGFPTRSKTSFSAHGPSKTCPLSWRRPPPCESWSGSHPRSGWMKSF